MGEIAEVYDMNSEERRIADWQRVDFRASPNPLSQANARSENVYN